MISEWLAPTTTASSAVFVLAHPDDEYFCLPLIKAELAGGRTVRVAYLTDGGPKASAREAESLNVFRKLGVDASHVVFAGREHGWNDGALHRHVTVARDWLGAWLGTLGPLARIYVTAYEGGHHDHDCCFGIVASLLRDGRNGAARCLQFPLYSGRALPGALFHCMTAIPENGPASALHFPVREGTGYWRMAASYPSQWKTFVALGPAAVGPYLLRRSVVVQSVDAERLRGAPHAGSTYFERRFKVPKHTVLDALALL